MLQLETGEIHKTLCNNDKIARNKCGTKVWGCKCNKTENLSPAF